MSEDLGESGPPPVLLHGEDFVPPKQKLPSVIEEIVPFKLTFEEATTCLNTLGKDETGARYAFIMLTASDRKLTDVSAILNFRHVLFVDVSGNYLSTEALDVLADQPFLIMLKADRNRAESASLRPMDYLQVLILGQNQIQSTASISQPLLESLDLNHNSIYEPDFSTSHLPSLKQLEMRANLLFELAHFYPPTLEKLYVPANKIAAIHPLHFGKLTHLQILHLRENNLHKLDGFSSTLESLKYLNLRSNKIGRLKEFLKLQCLAKLETLVVTGNPLPGAEPKMQQQKGEDFGESGPSKDLLLLSLLVILPNLKRINKKVITFANRIEAEDMHDAVMETVYADVSVSERDGSITSDLKTEESEMSERNEEENREENQKEII